MATYKLKPNENKLMNFNRSVKIPDGCKIYQNVHGFFYRNGYKDSPYFNDRWIALRYCKMENKN